MTGKPKSYVDSQLEAFEASLDECNVKLGLGNLAYNAETDRALSFSLDQLNALDPENCLNYAYKLQQYALFLQQKTNRLKSIKNWAKHNLTIIVAKEGKNYGDKYTKYEERIAMVASGDSYAQLLNAIMLKYESQIEDLDMMANRVANMAKTLSDLYMSKR